MAIPAHPTPRPSLTHDFEANLIYHIISTVIPQNVPLIDKGQNT